MDNMTKPKPGPIPDTVSQSSRAGWFHAREASRVLLNASLATDPDQVATLAELATAHALTSAAWSKLARNPGTCRTVKVGAR